VGLSGLVFRGGIHTVDKSGQTWASVDKGGQKWCSVDNGGFRCLEGGLHREPLRTNVGNGWAVGCCEGGIHIVDKGG